eukprot:GHVU01026143.1.p1 GENE.GHVU01026143.1~~GHVU01026143.1.p1  ORF type:complete len:159 (-),score=19.63 GHVU01026143.1:279-755(-)
MRACVCHASVALCHRLLSSEDKLRGSSPDALSVPPRAQHALGSHSLCPSLRPYQLRYSVSCLPADRVKKIKEAQVAADAEAETFRKKEEEAYHRKLDGTETELGEEELSRKVDAEIEAVKAESEQKEAAVTAFLVSTVLRVNQTLSEMDKRHLRFGQK